MCVLYEFINIPLGITCHIDIDKVITQLLFSLACGDMRVSDLSCIHSKFEEIYPPDVGEFVYITDDTYTKKQVLRMEHLILKVLKFDVAVPTSNQFLARFLKSANADKKTEMLASVSMV